MDSGEENNSEVKVSEHSELPEISEAIRMKACQGQRGSPPTS